MSTRPTRHGKITAEHEREAQALRALWEDRRVALKERGIASQEAFGDRFGIGNQAAVWQFLNARVPLSLKAALGFARGLECRVEDFSPRLAAQLAKHMQDAIGQTPAPAAVPRSAEPAAVYTIAPDPTLAAALRVVRAALHRVPDHARATAGAALLAGLADPTVPASIMADTLREAGVTGKRRSA